MMPLNRQQKLLIMKKKLIQTLSNGQPFLSGCQGQVSPDTLGTVCLQYFVVCASKAVLVFIIFGVLLLHFLQLNIGLQILIYCLEQPYMYIH